MGVLHMLDYLAQIFILQEERRVEISDLEQRMPVDYVKIEQTEEYYRQREAILNWQLQVELTRNFTLPPPIRLPPYIP